MPVTLLSTSTSQAAIGKKNPISTAAMFLEFATSSTLNQFQDAIQSYYMCPFFLNCSDDRDTRLSIHIANMRKSPGVLIMKTIPRLEEEMNSIERERKDVLE